MKPMRKILIALAALLLLLPSAALGNSWGLPGALFPLFHNVAAYADYYMAESDAQTAKGRPGEVAAFVMESRYHRELFVVRRQTDGQYAIEARSTLAVSQKDSGDFFIALEDDARLTFGERGLCSYTFEYIPFTGAQGGRWVLIGAMMTSAVPGSAHEFVSSALTVTRGEDIWDASYTIATPGQVDARWMTDTIVLWDAPEREGPGMNVFNAALFPQTADEVRALNRIGSMQTQPDMRPSMIAGTKNGGRYAVYTAPDEHSCRMAKGKAEVSLGGDVLLFGAQGEWAMIAYQVSPRTARIGYIHAPELARRAHGLFFTCAQAMVTQETFLTDDPLLSLYPQMTLRQGTRVTFLCQWDAYTACVQTSRDGQTIRGFVPLRALALPEPEQDAELRAALAGTSWRFLSGGSLLGDFLRFEADGTCVESCFDYTRPLAAEGDGAGYDGLYEEDEASRRRGTWAVTRGGGAFAALADEMQAVLTVTREDGTVSRAVLVIDGDVLDLRRGEAGGGYERLTEGVRQERRVNVFEDGDSFGFAAGAGGVSCAGGHV